MASSKSTLDTIHDIYHQYKYMMNIMNSTPGPKGQPMAAKPAHAARRERGPMTQRFQGSIAVVTGSGHGIGASSGQATFP
jgi:hypothetical protein